MSTRGRCAIGLVVMGWSLSIVVADHDVLAEVTPRCGPVVVDGATLDAAITAFIDDDSCTTIEVAASFVLSTTPIMIASGDETVFEPIDKPLIIDGNDHVIDTTSDIGGFVIALTDGLTATIEGLGMEGFRGVGALCVLSGDLVLSRSVFMDTSPNVPTTVCPGGAVSVRGAVEVRESQFIANTGESGGAIWAGGDLAVRNSTFAGNRAVAGGAIHAGGTLDIFQSTLTENLSETYSAIVAVGKTTIDFSTIVDNVSESSINGAAVRVGGSARVTRSIVHGNSGSETTIGDLDVDGELILTDSFVTSAKSVRLETLDPSVRTGPIHDLGPLAAYGGFSLPGGRSILTRIPGPLSPVIDRIEADDDVDPYDQRGPDFDRVRGDGADMGAVEYDPSDDDDPPPLLESPPPTDPPSADPPPAEPPASTDAPPTLGSPPSTDPTRSSPPSPPEPVVLQPGRVERITSLARYVPPQIPSLLPETR